MIRYGDLQLIDNSDEYLIIACDSSGGIGNKEGDAIQIEPELAGFFAAFVPLVEVLATKGNIVSLVNTLSVEMHPTGSRIIYGIKDAMKSIGLDTDYITGSTEDNIPSICTGIGVTVIGKIKKAKMNNKKIISSHQLVLVGIPKVGQEFLEEEVFGNKKETLTLDIMSQLSQDDCILDMIPVGSKGIKYEANILAQRYALSVKLKDISYDNEKIDYHKSAGPSTCLIMVIALKDLDKVKSYYKKIPIHHIGEFSNR